MGKMHARKQIIGYFEKNGIKYRFLTEFDLNMASDTYRKIEKVNAGKPSAVKAQLGKEFNSKVGKRQFASVEQIFINRKPKLTVSNRAAMYLIREVDNS